MNSIRYFSFVDWFCLFALICGDLANYHRRERRRVKRIVNGRSLYSHEIYNTHHMVQIKQVFGCTSLAPQYEHNFTGCSSRHMCGGSIVHPDFVMTACHCMTYKTYYSGEYDRDLPNTPVIGEWRDPWAPHGEYKSVFYPYHRDAENQRKMTYLKTYHPLLNTMGLFAGTTATSGQPQVRHGSAFFPHRLCMQRSEIVQQYQATEILWDIGVIRTCQPFDMKQIHQVSIAPVHPTVELKQWTDLALRRSTVCLYAGWGLTLGEGEKVNEYANPTFLRSPSVLQHAWRFVECSAECSRTPECVICSHQHGPAVNYPTMGDSGGPIVCDGHVIAIQSSGGADTRYNFSFTVDFTIACAADSVNNANLEELKLLKNNIFHWINGQPIPNDTKTFGEYLNGQSSSIPSQLLSYSMLILQISVRLFIH